MSIILPSGRKITSPIVIQHLEIAAEIFDGVVETAAGDCTSEGCGCCNCSESQEVVNYSCTIGMSQRLTHKGAKEAAGQIRSLLMDMVEEYSPQYFDRSSSIGMENASTIITSYGNGKKANKKTKKNIDPYSFNITMRIVLNDRPPLPQKQTVDESDPSV